MSKLSFDGQKMLLDVVMQVDVSVYRPYETYVANHGVAPTVDELAAYITEIRLSEADAVCSAIKAVADEEEE